MKKSIAIIVCIWTTYSLVQGQGTQPVVAIHDSELTRALESLPADANTPSGAGTSGKAWWPLNWHYFVMPESVEEALRSDGTPFKVVRDSDIVSGGLTNANGSPKYPIVISLAAEAVNDTEIAQFTNYVGAGGFLFVGSSAFTRNPDGSSRGDFAFANAMGLHMVNHNLANWYANELLTVTLAHPLVSHIPSGQLWWRMPLSAEDIPWGISPSHPINYYHLGWEVQASDATVIANAGDTTTTFPYILVKPYGKGYFIYHAGMQPLIGHGGNDSGMYAYGIFRNAIQWAFQTANLPVSRLSPWPYKYDAAVIFRHDFEDFTNFINATEVSAQFENSVVNAFGEPAKGDYYFCTGTLRTEYNPLDQFNEISSLSRAITLYGATIGSHNGGLPNPNNQALGTADYDYWHWGPDEVLDLTNLPPLGYANGASYALASIGNSFSDIFDWGLTNNTGLRQWVSPSFNATRESSKQLLAQLGIATAGEEKLGPFPHWTLSAQTSGLRYPVLSLPVSDWYAGTMVGQSIEAQSLASVDALVDYYYNLGALINLYGHSASVGPSIQANDGAGGVLTTSPQLEQEYILHSMAKPRVWAANADNLFTWWVNRSNAQIVAANTLTGGQSTTTISVSGARDANTAVEFYLPSTNYTGVQVLLNNVLAGTESYRVVGQTIRVLVGTSVTNVKIIYGTTPTLTAQNDAYGITSGNTLTVAPPGLLGNDTSGSGNKLTAVLISGPKNGALTLNSNGSFSYTPTNSQTSDTFTYMANDGQNNSAVASVTIMIIPITSPPVIAEQPSNQTIVSGSSANFTVGATSSVYPITTTWFMDTTNQLVDGGTISGSATASLTISSVTSANAGAYTVVVANSAGSVTSAPPATLTVTAPVDPKCTPPPMGLISWWPGDGNANDIMGKNNGTMEGVATATSSGVDGLCFNFDGTNGDVLIPDSPSLHPTNLTVEGWVRFNSLDSSFTSNPGHQYIVFKKNQDSINFEGFGLGKDRYPSVPIAGGDVFYFNASSADGTQTAEVDSSVYVATNTWYHVAGVRGPNFLQLYVNGQLQGTVSVNFPQNYTNTPLYFGTSGQSYWDGRLAGQLDEVSLYNRALSGAEIAAIYQAGEAGKCNPPPIAGDLPVLSITNVPPGLLISNAAFIVKGSATASVYYDLNNTGWLSATSFNGSNWTAAVTLASGTNTIAAYAVDASGNQSVTQVVNIIYAVTPFSTNGPAITIMSPSVGQQWAKSTFTIKGSATGKVPVTKVLYSLNNGLWRNATGTTKWSSSVALVPGTNTISAYAIDASGTPSIIQTVTMNYMVKTPLKLRVTGRGLLYPNIRKVSLQVGANYVMRAVDLANSGFTFANWTGGTNLQLIMITNGPTIQFQMFPKLVLQANFKDTNLPNIVITAPKAGQHWTRPTFTIKGTAKDNVHVAEIFYSLNSGVWRKANGTTKWSQKVTLVTGTNTILAYAMDSSGNVSATKSVTLTMP